MNGYEPSIISLAVNTGDAGDLLEGHGVLQMESERVLDETGRGVCNRLWERSHEYI